jgi:hypothetical protein
MARIQIILLIVAAIGNASDLKEQIATAECRKARSYEGDTCDFFATNWGLTVVELVNLVGITILWVYTL